MRIDARRASAPEHDYVYKFALAAGSTPVLYFVHGSVDRYLGKEAAEALVHHAHPSDTE